jgi:hypothetical protein
MSPVQTLKQAKKGEVSSRFACYVSQSLTSVPGADNAAVMGKDTLCN